MSKPKANKAQIKEALRTNGGVISSAAAALGMTRQSLWERVMRHDDLQAVVAEVEEQVLDMAETPILRYLGQLQKKAEPTEKELGPAMWWLERRGKHRGFSTQIQHTGKDDEPLFDIEAAVRALSDEDAEHAAALRKAAIAAPAAVTPPAGGLGAGTGQGAPGEGEGD